jgi:hypothetical protein
MFCFCSRGWRYLLLSTLADPTGPFEFVEWPVLKFSLRSGLRNYGCKQIYQYPASQASLHQCVWGLPRVSKMRIEKIVLEKSAETLLEKAEDCFDFAKTQHDQAEKLHEGVTMQKENAAKQIAIADQQHCEAEKLEAKADKLDAMGRALEAHAVEIKGDTLVVQRGRD